MKGLDELTANLQKLSKIPDSHCLTPGAVVLLQAIQDNAPVDSGTLRDSYEIVENAEPLGIAIATDVPYAADVEYGTQTMPAQPHVRPAIDAEKDSVGKAIAEFLSAQIGRS